MHTLKCESSLELFLDSVAGFGFAGKMFVSVTSTLLGFGDLLECWDSLREFEPDFSWSKDRFLRSGFSSGLSVCSMVEICMVNDDFLSQIFKYREMERDFKCTSIILKWRFLLPLSMRYVGEYVSSS